MAKNLVIVESPAKAKTINKFLGSKYKVVASMGHIIDLPKSKLGVDVENDFKPHYIVMTDRKKNLSALKKEAIARHAKPLAFFAAAIFLLHPIQTQPVDYIIQRATLLAALFYIASLSLYVKTRLIQGQEGGTRLWQIY